MNNMRRGFTMIELIFVIVIIGILAAVAIPKLAATRDDAKQTAQVADMKTCLNNVTTEYQATATKASLTAAPCTNTGITATDNTPASGELTVAGDLTTTTFVGRYSGTNVSY